MSKTVSIVSGAVLVALGLALLVLAGLNSYAQMDRVDREGGAGNLFALDVFWLGLVGLLALALGAIALTRPLRHRDRPIAAR
ncbi:hypothetical protein [Microbacterium sp. MM2322]|uniref:hypothetical protein n=1 Tax=Microbacterium sp. MM2322 TaxID=3157631 RepID=UPI0032D59EDC